ncbi:MAG: MazG nucleotide pyrophosphohydrolase domain-containing protein [Candidatus Kariarchaeaceae archaeon]|jgi:NTP pyrophosphatase (non-canonical NTP hydrolase)
MEQNTISHFQSLMRELYFERDSRRGIDKCLLWLQSEQGELIDAYMKGNLTAMEEEVADILAWLCSVCNLLEIDLEKSVLKKYPQNCPKCMSKPCRCDYLI